MSSIGLPSIIITFSSKAASAITRSARGIVAMILNDENVSDSDGVKTFTITDTTDIPTAGVSDSNVDLIKKCLLGTPSKIQAVLIPPATHTEEKVVTEDVEVESDVVVTDADTGATETVSSTVTITQTTTETVTVNATVKQADALKEIANTRYNYICHPTGTAQDMQDLVSWTKTQRNNKHKTCKAVVANCAADDYGVINFTTKNINLDNPAYADALALADGDESEVEVPKYITYTTANYTARIAGIFAGLSLDRSATYYELPEIASVDEYRDDDIETHIDNGELCLFDEKDDNGVKIARGINSLTSFTSDVGQDFRFAKIVEALDLIKDDISTTFKTDYVGKVINSYDNKMLLIAAINQYFHNLEGQGVLNPDFNNRVELDLNAHIDYAKTHSIDISDMSDAEILKINTGVEVFLTGFISVANAMEGLQLSFMLS